MLRVHVLQWLVVIFNVGKGALAQGDTFSDTYPCEWRGDYAVYSSVTFVCEGVPTDGSSNIYAAAEAEGAAYWALSIDPINYYCAGSSACSYVRRTFLPTGSTVTITLSAVDPVLLNATLKLADNGASGETWTYLSDQFPCSWDRTAYLAGPYSLECSDIPANPMNYPFRLSVDVYALHNGLFSIQASSNIERAVSNSRCSPTDPCSSYTAYGDVLIEQGTSITILLKNEQYYQGYPEVAIDVTLDGGPSASGSSGHASRAWLLPPIAAMLNFGR